MDQEPKPNEAMEPAETLSSPSNTPINTMQTPVVPPIPVRLPADEAVPSFEMEHPAEDSNTTTTTTTTMSKMSRSNKGIGKTVLIIAVIVLVAIAGVAAYWWRDTAAKDFEKKQATNISTLNAKVATLQTKLAIATNTVNLTIAQTTCSNSILPTAATISSIKAAVVSNNTAALDGYMAAIVGVLLAASDGTVGTPAQAIASINSFVSGAKSPWNFDLSSTVLAKYSAGGYAKYFPASAIVGLSTDNKVISFNFDCNARVNTVFLSSSDSLLN